MIFDERTVHRLENLSLAATRIRAGQIKGERRSPRKGASIEFADHRSYSQGDDLRRVDWNIYARSGRPYVKQYNEEEDLAVNILLDASESMDWGEGEENKFKYGLRLGSGLGLMALTSGDQLTVSLLAGERISSRIGPLRGRPSLPRLLNFFETQIAGGLTDLNHVLQNFSRQPGRAGLAILISDLFSPAGFLDGLRALQKTGHEVILVQTSLSRGGAAGSQRRSPPRRSRITAHSGGVRHTWAHSSLSEPADDLAARDKKGVYFQGDP